MTENIQPLAGTHPRPTLANADPTIRVRIRNPRPDTRVVKGMPFLLEASARGGGEDLSSEIYWHSSRAGFLGRGGSVQATLGDGTHIITALVVVRRGRPTAQARTSATASAEDGLSLGIDSVSIDPTNYDDDGGGG